MSTPQRSRRTLEILIALALACQGSAALAAPREVTSAEAATKIGRSVYFATGSATPLRLMDSMRQFAVARGGHTDVFHMATFAGSDNFTPELAKDTWHPNFFFVSDNGRKAATDGLATLHRDSLFNLAKRIEKDEFAIDTVVVRVSPPVDGKVSLGSTGDLTLPIVQSVLRRGGQVIAEVNPHVPDMQGNRIAYADLAYVVKSDGYLTEANPTPLLDEEAQIAKNVAKLVPNRRRTTLQVGIGQAVKGVGEAMVGKKKLDIWSEMGLAGLIQLASGDKPVARKATFGFMHADNASYEAAAKSGRISIGSALEVNDPAVIATKKGMVAVNTALEVSVLGDSNAERDGQKIISFPGGQPDFMDGASRAADGKAIMAVRSLSTKGFSGVVLDLKGPVTTPRNHVDYVVTEWGATKRLRGKSDAFRAYEIIRVSHPLMRAKLAEQAQERHLIDQKQVEKLKRSVFPTVMRAPESYRGALAEEAEKQGALTKDQLELIQGDLAMAALPAQPAAIP